MKKQQHGFGIPGIVIVIVLMGLIGLGSWYVWLRQHPKKPSATVTLQPTDRKVSSPSAKTANKPLYAVPQDYSVYENKELGF